MGHERVLLIYWSKSQMRCIVPIRVMNTRGYRLPKTGDTGTTLLAAGGMTLAVLSAAAVILLLVFKKKDKFDD